MANPPRITVTNEDENGRNTNFYDNVTDKGMTLNQFVKAIENGNYPDYHLRVINGVKTPVSNPDKNANNNLN